MKRNLMKNKTALATAFATVAGGVSILGRSNNVVRNADPGVELQQQRHIGCQPDVLDGELVL
ncbi:MAG: hypothetical protein ABIX37_07480 [Gammaproteobacteria bacterium]